MNTSVLGPEMGDWEVQNENYLAGIRAMKLEASRSKPAQQQTLSKQIIDRQRDYFNFLKDAGHQDEAQQYLEENPEIENSQSAAA